MAANTLTKPLDALASTTLEKVRPVMADNIFKGNPVLFKLYDKRQVDDGGLLIAEPLMYATSTTAKWMASGYDTLDTTAQEGISQATFTWKNLTATISISAQERRRNSGDTAVLNLLKGKIAQAEMTLREIVGKEILQAPASKDPNSLTGLGDIIDNADPPATTVGGINPATYTWWRNQVEDPVTNSWKVFLAQLYIKCTEGREHPDLTVTTKAVYGNLEAQMAGQVRVTSKEFDDFGYDNVLYKGMPIVADFFCEAGLLYMINTNFIRLHVHREADFAVTPFQKPVNQQALIAAIDWEGQLTVNNRRFHGVNVTTALSATVPSAW